MKLNAMDIIKIGNIELTEAEAAAYYESGKRYFLTYSKIYYIDYSVNAGYNGRIVYISTSGHFTHKGRFFAYDAAQVNHLLGFKLFNED